MRHRQRRERRAAGTPTVIQDTVHTRKLYLAAAGRARAAGTLVDPFPSWGDVVDGLRAVYAGGGRAAIVRIIGPAPPLENENRARIRELEGLGMRLEFLALEGRP
ncbi:MAG: hypothetical protein ACREU5_06840 [Burkholderiales bacterium]